MGVRTATVSIPSNDTDRNPYIVNFTGEGIAQPVFPFIVGTPNPAVYLDTLVNTDRPKDFTITNTGSALLSFTNFILTNTTDYLVQTNACDGNDLAQNESCIIRIVFNPKSVGKKDGTLQIQSNDPRFPNNNPYTLVFSGTGFINQANSPHIRVQPNPHNFGSIEA